MRYVYGKEIVKPIPASAIVKIVFGSILAGFMLTFVFIAVITNLASHYSDSSYNSSASPIATILSLLPMFMALTPASLLLLIFGIKGVSKSRRTTPQHNPQIIFQSNPGNPFFTVCCEHCGTKFAYQHSDLGYRAWYPNGYVRCPLCDNAARHNALQNAYSPE